MLYEDEIPYTEEIPYNKEEMPYEVEIPYKELARHNAAWKIYGKIYSYTINRPNNWNDNVT